MEPHEPQWFVEELRGRRFKDALGDSRFREQYLDAVACLIREQEMAGLDIVTDGDSRFDLTVGGKSWFFYVIERLRGTPGVDAAGISQLPPLARAWEFPVAPLGQTGGVEAQFNSVSSGLFETLGVRIVSGRDFAWSDTSRAPRVAVVSQHLARTLFGEREALRDPFRGVTAASPVDLTPAQGDAVRALEGLAAGEQATDAAVLGDAVNVEFRAE